MEKSIGALWVKQGKSGEYWTGNIEINNTKQNITIFKNNYKKDKQPDFRIYIQKQNKQEEGTFIPNDSELPF